ncbi:MAG: HD domain-containing protein [Pirellulaceae bacterium]|nr:HD domain-containing protein [Pirellulaceae bacterium]
MTWNEVWEAQIADWVQQQMTGADAAHGLDHVRRVVVNARMIAVQEGAILSVVLPAAWLHDCVIVAKNSSLRGQASRLAAERAGQYLRSINYPTNLIDAIAHCIQAHSFSAGITCETLEAQIVQDADRLEALGAIGIARCLMTGGALRQQLYDPQSPFPVNRAAADDVYSIDHFFVKLFRLPSTMHTATGRQLAGRRSAFMIEFLRQLASEIAADPQQLEWALRNATLPNQSGQAGGQ